MSRLGNSFSCAIRGIVCSVSSGENMKIHLLAAGISMGLGLVLGISKLEWAILSITIFMVLAAETINTAIERTVDLVTMDYHPLAKLAKDLAAGGVLLTAINAVIVAIIIFGSNLMKLVYSL